MEKNKTYRAEITGLTAEGAGVARIDGQVVFVPGVIPGKHARSKLTTSEEPARMEASCV